MDECLDTFLVALFFFISAAFAADPTLSSQTEINTVLITVFGIVLTASLGVVTKLWFDARTDAKVAKALLVSEQVARTKQRDDEHAASVAAEAALREEVAVLRESIKPVNAAFLRSCALGLTHAIHPITDDLVQKAVNGTMTQKEELELKLALEERAENPGPFVSEIETDAAKMFPMVLRRVNAEIALGYRTRPAQEKIQEAPNVAEGNK